VCGAFLDCVPHEPTSDHVEGHVPPGYQSAALKELKKQLRGIRPIERALDQRTDTEAEVIRGYCLAVRSALTDDGRPPLEAPGLRLNTRITALVASLTRISEKGACRVS
jgi:hypothetical protein